MQTNIHHDLVFVTTHQIGREKHSKKLIGAAASTRLRAIIPAEYLSTIGYTTQIISLHHTVWKGTSITLPKSSLVIVSKVLSESGAREVIRLHSQGVRMIFDFCDNYFDGGEFSAITHELLGIARETVVNTFEMASVIRKYNKSCSINIIEDPIEGTINPSKLIRSEGPIHILLFGSKHVISHFETWVDPLNSFASSRQVQIEILTLLDENVLAWERSISRRLHPNITLTLTLWNEYQLAYCFKRSDLVLIPSTYDPFNFTKSPNRLLESVTAGIPTIAFPLSCYRPYAKCLPVTDDLLAALVQIQTSPEITAVKLMQAQILAQTMHSRDAVGKKWATLLAEKNRHRSEDQSLSQPYNSIDTTRHSRRTFTLDTSGYDQLQYSIRNLLITITGLAPDLVVTVTATGYESFNSSVDQVKSPVNCIFRNTQKQGKAVQFGKSFDRLTSEIVRAMLITDQEYELIVDSQKSGLAPLPIICNAKSAYTLYTRLLRVTEYLDEKAELVDWPDVIKFILRIMLGLFLSIAISDQVWTPLFIAREHQ
jgi:hypothetical protein